MPKIRFEPSSPGRLPAPKSGQVDYWDAATPGFGLRVSQGGARSWVAMLQQAGRKRRLTFGTYPELSLDAARQQLEELLRRPGSMPVLPEMPRPSRRRPGRPRKYPPPQPSIGAHGPTPPADVPDAALSVDQAPCAIVALAEQRIRHVNPWAVGLFAAPGAESLAGRPIDALVHPADRARFAMHFLGPALAHQPRGHPLRLRFLRLNDTEFAAEVSGRVVPGASGADRLLALRDVSEHEQALDGLRRGMERFETVDRARREFIATLSHELRLPLAAMSETLGLLTAELIEPEQRRYAHASAEAADALLVRLHDAEDPARIESGKWDLVRAPIALRPFLDDIVSLFAAGARTKGVALTLQVAEAVPEIMKTDGGRLRQVLVNLIANAVKFTDAGSIVVGAALQGEHARRPLLRFDVRDTGIGIPANRRPQILAPLAPPDPGGGRTRTGAELGLVIVQSLVAAMGGVVGFESEFRQGSRFHVTVPVDAVAASEPASPQTIPQPPAKTETAMLHDIASYPAKTAAGVAIDLEALDQLKSDIGTPALIRLARVAIAETARRIERMSRAFAAGDRAALGREAHALKSAAATFGAVELRLLATALERAANEELSGEVPELMERLPALARATLDTLEAMFGE